MVSLGLGGEKSQLSTDYSRPLLYRGGRGRMWCSIKDGRLQGLDGGSELSWFFTFGSKMVIPGPEGRYARPKGMGV